MVKSRNSLVPSLAAVLVALVSLCVRPARAASGTAAYAWTGGAGDGLWTSPGNWDCAGAVPTTAPTLGTDTIVFPTGATVTLPTSQKTYTEDNLTLGGSVTFKIPGNGTICLTNQVIDQDVAFLGPGKISLSEGCTVGGTGTLALANCTLSCSAGNTGAGTVTCNLKLSDFSAECGAGLQLDGASIALTEFCAFKVNDKGSFRIGNGATTKVSGDAKVTVTCSNASTDGTFVPNADFSAFRGSFTVVVPAGLPKTAGSMSCDGASFATDFSGSAWSIYMSGTVPEYTSDTTHFDSLAPWRYAGRTVRYGQLSMNIPQVGIMGTVYQGNTLEIGFLDKDGYLGGTWYEGSNYPIVWLAPTATLTNTTANTYAITVKGGGELSFGGVTTGVPAENVTFSEKGGYLLYEAANFAAVTNRLVVDSAPLGFDVPAGQTCVFDPALLPAGSCPTYLLKKGEGLLSVPENTLFTNALSFAQQQTVTITDRPADRRVAFVTDEATGCLKATLVEGVEIRIDGNTVSNQIGTLEASGDVVKSGAGTLALVGTNVFGGVLAVNAGTLSLPAPYDAVGTLFARFDPTRPDTISYTNGVFEKIADANGGSVVLQATNDAQKVTVTSVEGVLGGKTVFYGDKARLYASACFIDRVESTFMVWHPIENNDYITPMATSKADYDVQRASSTSTVYQTRRLAKYKGENVYANGGAASVTMDVDQLLCVNNSNWIGDKADTLAFGSGLACYLGEIVVYSNQLSEVRRPLVESYLMTKWGIGSATYAPLASSAAVSVASGATLDLGALRPAIASLRLSSGATINVDSAEIGDVVLTAGAISAAKNVNLTIGGVHKPSYRVKVVSNSDGTQSLVVYVRRGFTVIMH